MTVVFAAKAMHAAGANPNVSGLNMACVAGASVVMLVGAATPFSKPNAIFGVRTSRTMNDMMRWKRANIAAGAVMTAAGIGLNILYLLQTDPYVNIGVFAATAVVAAATVFVLSRPKKRRAESDRSRAEKTRK